MNEGTVYKVGYWITWIIIFIATWIYCIAEYGFLLGVGLGWLASAICAFFLSLFWPLYVAVIAYAILNFMN